MSQRRDLPRLLDRKGIEVEMGVKRATAEAIMRLLPKVEVPGLRKTFVFRDDVLSGVNTWTRHE